MTDIALVWDYASGTADLALDGNDLLIDQGLQTAVLISLFTDAQAQPGDTIPDGTTDARGWWGDLPLLSDADAAGADYIGSGLWIVVERGVIVDDTLRQVETRAGQSLAWMQADGVAGTITAVAVSPNPGWIETYINIAQGAETTPFNFLWQHS